MKIITWNLNGLLSCVKNQSFQAVAQRNPSVVCCQEIRTKQQPEVIPEYYHFWNPSERDGYSGTLIMTRDVPEQVIYGLGKPDLDAEGRVMTVEYEDFYVVNAYAPNSQKNLRRHYFRMEWDEAFRFFISDLAIDKPVIACGDFNVALTDIDIYPENMRQYWAQQGYASDERANLQTLVESGFVDAFRFKYPELEGAYTWWSNRLNKRLENRGWRLDYFFVSETITDKISGIDHLTEIMGSDHCPVELDIAICQK